MLGLRTNQPVISTVASVTARRHHKALTSREISPPKLCWELMENLSKVIMTLPYLHLILYIATRFLLICSAHQNIIFRYILWHISYNLVLPSIQRATLHCRTIYVSFVMAGEKSFYNHNICIYIYIYTIPYFTIPYHTICVKVSSQSILVLESWSIYKTDVLISGGSSTNVCLN